MWAKAGIDKSRISAITDEIGLSTLEAIAFAHYYGHAEHGDPQSGGPRQEGVFPAARRPRSRADADLFAREGLKVSFVNTSLLKFTWPGTEPARKRNETPEARERRLAAEKARFDRRLDDAQLAIRCAQIMGCDKIRVFGGTRVADPPSMYQRIADELGERSANWPSARKVYFLLENEGSQNCGHEPGTGRRAETGALEMDRIQLGPEQRPWHGSRLPRRLQRAPQGAHDELADQGPGHHAAQSARGLEDHHHGTQQR